jgi:hypothetical protein
LLLLVDHKEAVSAVLLALVVNNDGWQKTI